MRTKASTSAHGQDLLAEVPDENREAVAAGLDVYGQCFVDVVRELENVDAGQIETVSGATARTANLLLRHTSLRGEVPRKRWAVVDNALSQIVDVLVEQSMLPDVSSTELEAQAQAAVDAFTVLVRGDSEHLQSFVDALKPAIPDAPDAVSDAAAEARGRLRLRALYSKLIKDSYTIGQLTDAWGISRQRIHQLREDKRLFAVKVPYQKSFLYPAWQFEPGGPTPRPVMPALIDAAQGAELDSISFHQIMTNPDAGNGVAPYELLDQGRDDLVLGILRANR